MKKILLKDVACIHCRGLDQINSAIKNISASKNMPDLKKSNQICRSFIQAAFEKKEISKSQKISLEKKARKAYRSQLINDLEINTQ